MKSSIFITISYKWLFFFLSLFILTLISCIKKNQTENCIDSIICLKTNEEKEGFLFDIFQDDQTYRNQTSQILKKNNYDFNSLEYKNHIEKINIQDSVNFEKVLLYLKLHGYPDFTFANELASYAITAVALHQPYDNQLLLIPYLKQAYEEQYYSSKNFSFLLNRMHIMKYDKSYSTLKNDSLYIDQLFKKLDIY